MHCFNKIFLSLLLEFTCQEKLHIVLLLDSSDYVTSKEWNEFKQFAANFIKRFNRDSVDIDIVSIGSRVELIESLDNADQLKGSRYLTGGFMMAQRLLEASTARRIVLSVTARLHGSTTTDGNLQNVLQNLKSTDVDMMSVLLDSSGKHNGLSEEYRKFTSKPFGKNLFKIAGSSSLKRISEVLSRAACRSA